MSDRLQPPRMLKDTALPKQTLGVRDHILFRTSDIIINKGILTPTRGIYVPELDLSQKTKELVEEMGWDESALDFIFVDCCGREIDQNALVNVKRRTNQDFYYYTLTGFPQIADDYRLSFYVRKDADSEKMHFDIGQVGDDFHDKPLFSCVNPVQKEQSAKPKRRHLILLIDQNYNFHADVTDELPVGWKWNLERFGFMRNNRLLTKQTQINNLQCPRLNNYDESDEALADNLRNNTQKQFSELKRLFSKFPLIADDFTHRFRVTKTKIDLNDRELNMLISLHQDRLGFRFYIEGLNLYDILTHLTDYDFDINSLINCLKNNQSNRTLIIDAIIQDDCWHVQAIIRDLGSDGEDKERKVVLSPEPGSIGNEQILAYLINRINKR